MSYKVFTRTWWTPNTEWPNGLEPCIGEESILMGADHLDTEDEAKRMCREYNRIHTPGRLSRKAEYRKN